MKGPFVEHYARESRDGTGAGDRDAPFVFGRLPRVLSPFPFSMRELARLMLLRSRVRDGQLTGDTAADRR
jgi:hypothetical protein